MRVSRTISPNDKMFDTTESYFSTGPDTLRCLEEAGITNPGSILDWACGHGRVLRFLRAAFPDAEITAADLDRDGVDFCSRTFGAKPLYSDPDPVNVLIEDRFDLIWSGSFFTHMGEWGSWLSLLRDALAPEGMLVFTTIDHETASILMDGWKVDGRQALADYEKQGFGFMQDDVTCPAGLSIATPEWVSERLIENHLMPISITPKAWRNRHDVVVCKKGILLDRDRQAMAVDIIQGFVP